ncbi:Serine/threonine-protein kinase smu1, partial [Coemansia sp. RSA 2599]
WQQQNEGLVVAEGMPFDLFYGKTMQPLRPAEDRLPDRHLATVKFPKKQHPNSLAFSTKGEYLATGSADGFVEIWNFMIGKLAADLRYQSQGSLMMMEEAVTSLSFSHSGDLVCSGAKDGKIRVWKIKSGSCYKRFLAAHSKEVSCVCFSHDDTQILSGGYDNILRIHGLKSGNMLKEFRGHSAAITSAAFSQDMGLVLSTSEDGTLRIWDASSAACLHTVTPGADKNGLSIPTVSSVMPVPGSPETFVVCTKSPSIYIVSSSGIVEKTLALKEELQNKEFLAAVVSPQGKYVLAVSDKSVLHGFSIETGQALDECHKVADSEIVGMAGHPSLNVVAFFSNDRRVPIWASLASA